MIYTYYNFEIYHYIEEDLYHLSMHDWIYEFKTLDEAKQFVKKYK
jgi:hypothetical protein